jgi:SAM-dependent methyltransferase
MPEQAPSSDLFFQTVSAYQQTAALKAAIELDLFTAIAEGHRAVPALAQRCEAPDRGIRILCDFLCVVGFLTKEESVYDLTRDSATFLDRNAPAYLGGTVEFVLSPRLTGGFEDLATVVRNGGTLLSDGGTLAPEDPVWVRFARAMAATAAPASKLLAKLVDPQAAKPLRVLDIAAGHGLYGIAVAQANPQAEVMALDWPSVLEVATENAQAAGVAERHRLIEGSAFETDFGEGYDLVLLTNFLHHFDAATCGTLLRKVHAALAPGGRAVTLEYVPDEGRVSPRKSAMFALTMLASTPSGDAYTFSELAEMFRQAGFSRSELHDLPPTVQRVVVSQK